VIYVPRSEVAAAAERLGSALGRDTAGSRRGIGANISS
jgi:hypothetical protein